MKTHFTYPKSLWAGGVSLLGASLAPMSLQAQLVSYYSFDDADIIASTQGQVDQAGSNNLIPTGAEGGTSIITGQSGLFAQAYQFTRDSIGTATDPTAFENIMRTEAAPIGASPTEFTVSLWFNRAANSIGQNKLFGLGDVNSDGDATTAEGFDVGLEGGGIRIRNGGGFVTYGLGMTFLPGSASEGWHHLAVRVNAGGTTFRDVDIFLDGAPLAPMNLDEDVDFDDTLVMPETTLAIAGGRADAFLGEGFTGLMDEVRVFANAISDEEISELAVAPDIIEPEIASFTDSANGDRIAAGTTVTFDFEATGAETLTLSGPGGDLDVTGQTTASVAVPSTGGFTLTARNATGQLTQARLPVFVGSAAPEPIVRYTFDDMDLAGTIVNDTSGSGRNGEIFQSEGDPDVVTGQPGQVGEAFQFLPDSPGIDGVVDIPIESLAANPVPATAPPIPDGASARTFSMFFSAEAINGQNLLFQQGNTNVSLGIGPVDDGIAIRNGANVGVWGQGFDWVGDNAGFRFLVVRVNPGATTFRDVDVFVDGEQLLPMESELLGQSLLGIDGVVSVGGPNLFAGPNRDFAGLVDEFQLYDEALSNSDIVDLTPVVPRVLTFVSDQPGVRSDSQTLSWTVEGVVALELNPGAIDVTDLDSTTVSLTETTTFTLTATGDSGEVVSSSVTLFAGETPATLVSYSFDSADTLPDGLTLVDGTGANDAVLMQIGDGAFAINQPGLFAQAVSFSGQDFVNSAVAIGPTGVLPAGADSRTISLWFNQTTLALGTNKIFGYGDELIEGDVPGSGEGLDVSLEGGGIRLRFFGGNITYGSGNDFLGADAGWHNVAVRVNEDAATFADVDVFLDGVQQPVTASAGAGLTAVINTNDSAFGIGNTSIAENGAQTGFNGLVDRFMAFDGALSGSEIAELAVMPPPVGALLITAVSVDAVNSAINFTLDVEDLNTPYFLEAGPDLSNLTAVPDSAFTPTASPFEGSLSVDLQANPTFFLRVVAGEAP